MYFSPKVQASDNLLEYEYVMFVFITSALLVNDNHRTYIVKMPVLLNSCFSPASP